MCPLLYSDKSITTAPLLALLASLSLGYDPFFFFFWKIESIYLSAVEWQVWIGVSYLCSRSLRLSFCHCKCKERGGNGVINTKYKIISNVSKGMHGSTNWAWARTICTPNYAKHHTMNQPQSSPPPLPHHHHHHHPGTTN